MLDPGATGVIKHSFKPMPGREAVETILLESGDSIEILYRGCEYEEIQIQIESSKFTSLPIAGAVIYTTAATALRELSKYEIKSIYVFPFNKAASALLRAGKMKSPPPLRTEVVIPIVEGMNAAISIKALTKKRESGTLVMNMYRGPL